MATDTIKDYLIRLGFKVDETQQRNFSEGMRNAAKMATEVTKSFMRFAEASTIATAGLAVAMTAIAKPLDGMYWAAQRTRSSAKDLDVFTYAAQQVGISAEQAQGAVEALAAARRTNPGLNGQLAGLGIDPRQISDVKVLTALLARLHSMPHYQAAAIASNYGLDEQFVYQMEQNGPDVLKYMKEREQQLKDHNVNMDAMARRSRDFMRAKNRTERGLLDVTQQTATDEMPTAEKLLGAVDKATTKFEQLDKATGGLLTQLLALSVVLKGYTTVFSLMGVGKLLTRGAVGAGGAAAEGVGAEVGGSILGLGGGVAAGTIEGGGLVAAVSAALPAIIPIVVGVAAMAGLTWMATHPEEVRKAVSSAWNWVKEKTASISQSVADLNSQVKTSGGWTKALSLIDGPIGDLARFTAKFEGFRDSIYKDVGGKATFGFGHLVRPGEDLSHAGPSEAFSIFAKDLNSAVMAIHRLVKVKLTNNQTAALADLEFNIGEKKFADSTLLKKLNSGDFEGAARQFERWNKVFTNGHYIVNEGLEKRRAAETRLFSAPDRAIALSSKTDIHIEGGDARETGREVARQQERVNSLLVRDFLGATR